MRPRSLILSTIFRSPAYDCAMRSTRSCCFSAIHQPGKRHGFSVGLDSDLRVREGRLALELVLNLLLDLSRGQALRRWRLCVRRSSPVVFCPRGMLGEWYLAAG